MAQGFTEQLKGDLVEAVVALNEPGDTTTERVGFVVRQLLAAGLLDELHLCVACF
jgi:hypothetical protein